jgi:hypothetical protein
LKQLPGYVAQKYQEAYGIAPSKEMLMHLKRELVQEIWALLLTPRFMHAYVHGMVLVCADHIKRRLYPRLLIYMADYPEKRVS